jgi:hypothetical protein
MGSGLVKEYAARVIIALLTQILRELMADGCESDSSHRITVPGAYLSSEVVMQFSVPVVRLWTPKLALSNGKSVCLIKHGFVYSMYYKLIKDFYKTLKTIHK